MFLEWPPIMKLIWLKSNHIIGAVWKTISDVAVATFSTLVAASVKSLVVDITPAQSGSGIPSPDNVRTISGWSGVNIVVSPTLDAQDGTTTAISWQDEAGTVYNGTLDVVNGNLTAESAIVDLGDLSWSRNTGGNIIVPYFQAQRALDFEKSRLIGICDCYQFALISNSQTQEELTDYSFYFTNNNIRVRDSRYSSYTAFTAAVAGHKLVYALNTPVVYQIAPETISTLLGQNNVWADSGNIVELTYRKN